MAALSRTNTTTRARDQSQLCPDCGGAQTCSTLALSSYHQQQSSMKTSVPVIILTCLLGGSQQLHLAQDGGYRDIVVKISDNLDMRKCSDIISGIKVKGDS